LYDAKTIRELKEKLKADTDRRTKDAIIAVTHLSASCPERERAIKCFKCNQYGHVAAKCTAKATDARNVKKYNVAQTDTGLIKLHLKTTEINNHKAKAFNSSDSTLCMMSEDCHNKIGAPPLINQTMQFRDMGKGVQETLGKVQKCE